eukprot:358545-Amphidinium_carterae.1
MLAETSSAHSCIIMQLSPRSNSSCRCDPPDSVLFLLALFLTSSNALWLTNAQDARRVVKCNVGIGVASCSLHN